MNKEKRKKLGPFPIGHHEFASVLFDDRDNIDLIPLTIDKHLYLCQT